MKSGKTVTDSAGQWELTSLYEQHYTKLVRAAMRLLDTQHLAEEAVQDVFVRLHTSDACPAPGCELAYLRTAVMNRAKSMLRRRQVATRCPVDPPLRPTPVDELCIGRVMESQVRRFCDQLPDRQRQVLELRYWQGLSVGETADRLSISTGSVKTHASRGRERLREQFVDQVA